MGIINVLSKDISELIAAGEVIERPASIIKELLENSIDAGATAVTVEIKNGGISYIRVTDNGCGMSAEDLGIAFLRHATSKIKAADDLNSIGTLGFRGEALASVCAVSRVEMISKTRDMQLGCKLVVEGGEQLDFDNVGAQDGTTVIVKDLFYNVPARLKFLKKDTSEAATIQGIVDKIAISKPQISIKLISDGKVKLHTPGNGDELSAVHAVFGEEFSSALIPVNYEMNGVKVSGFTAKSQYARNNRGMQHFFVNSRYVRSRTCMSALEEAYKNMVMTGKYPACVLNISLNFGGVDVNVHPAKIEVRFTDEKAVWSAVYFAIKSALSADDLLLKPTTVKSGINGNPVATFKNDDAPQLSINAPEAEEKNNNISVKPIRLSDTNPLVTAIDTTASKVASPQAAYTSTKINAPDFTYISSKSFEEKNTSIDEKSINKVLPVDENDISKKREAEALAYADDFPSEKNNFNATIIGELFSTYLVFELQEDMLLLDKHAAHERIIFESLKRSISLNDRQILLKPEVIALSADENRAVFDNIEVFERLGFLVEEFGNHSVVVREAPMLMLNADIQSIITDIIKKIMENKRDILGDSLEELLHSMACRAAIKANDKSDISELTALLYEVHKNDDIRNCPHGRPIFIKIAKTEIEKKFGRIQ